MQNILKVKTIILQALKQFGGELLLLLGLYFLLNGFLGNNVKTIASDGVSYYEYLPAIFIYGDFGVDKKKQVANEEYNRNRIEFLVKYKGKLLNKYGIGTAVLIAPFFTYAHLSANRQGFENDGYSYPYQKAVFHAALFYLFLGLLFLKGLLLFYDISKFHIFIVQLLVVFSTSLIYYTTQEAAFSHVYSFFTISAFLFVSKKYFTTLSTRYFLWMCLLFGLIFLIRPVNIIILLFVPFIAGSKEILTSGINNIYKQARWLISGILISISMICLQFFAWYIQTGEFFLYTYQDERFNFLSPAFIDILFSYRKGLFVYTPSLFIALGGLYFWIKEKNYYLLFTWTGFFILMTYVLCSWWQWYYGCSYGLRAYIDFYAIFCIPLAILLSRSKPLLKSLLLPILVFATYINVIQTYQYKNYILSWFSMDKQRYWEIFLKQDRKYSGLFWKPEYNFVRYPAHWVKTDFIKEVFIPGNIFKDAYATHSSSIKDFDSVNMIRIKFDNDFIEKEETEIEVSIVKSDTTKVFYFNKMPLIHFSEKGLNRMQRGEYNFEFDPVKEKNDLLISCKVTTHEAPVILKNFEISFIKAQL